MKARSAFWLIFAAAAVGFPAISGDFGINYDEYAHREHGRILFEYFTGKSDQAGKPPSSGTQVGEVLVGSESRITAYMNAFGGFFDLTAEAGYETIGKRLGMGDYEFRHLVNSLYGVFAILVVGLLARDLGGWGAGALAMGFAALSPRFVAHSMNNPKDLPFAALYISCLYLIHRIIRDFPKVVWRDATFLGLGIGIAVDIRIGALLLIGYLGAVLLAEALLYANSHRGDRRRAARPLVPPAAMAIGVVALAYATSVAFWPFAQTHPLEAHRFALQFFSHFDIYDSFNLFEGRWIHRWEIPWYYLLKWIWITVPLSIAAGILLTPLVFMTRGTTDFHPRALHSLILLAFATAFPVFYIIVTRANVYDEARHVLFVLPALYVLGALAWCRLFEMLKRRVARQAAAVILAAFLIEPGVWMVRNHPHEAFYFSPVIGGTAGAFKNYDIDYWGSSLRSAAEWIVGNVPPGTNDKLVRVRAWYGHGLSLRYFLEKHPGYKYVAVDEASPDWDYSVLLPAAAKYSPEVLRDWPPQGTVHQIMAGGAPINAIIRNPLQSSERSQTRSAPIAGSLPGRDKPEGNLMNDGLILLYARHDPVAAAATFRRVLELNPSHYGAHYQLAVALDNAGRRAEARPYWETVLRLAEAYNDQRTAQTARTRLQRKP